MSTHDFFRRRAVPEHLDACPAPDRRDPRWHGESGIALVASLLVTLLVSALLVGFTSLVISDQKIRTADADGTQAFYAAHAGLEKLTSDLGTLFEANYAASGAQIQAQTANPPALPQVSYLAPNGSSGYTIAFPTNNQGNPVAQNRTIGSGPFQGFVGLLTQFDITVTARGIRNSEAQLRRSLQLVAIPLFQFGVFSESDLGFHAGPDFDFGGRVHTNGSLYLAGGGTLTLADRDGAQRSDSHALDERLSQRWGVGRRRPRQPGPELVPRPRTDRGEPGRHHRFG